MESAKPIEHQALNLVSENDADLDYLKDADDYEMDGTHYQLTKMYGLAFKLPAFFAAIKDLKADGFIVEPQISVEEEKVVLLVTRNILGGESESEPQD